MLTFFLVMIFILYFWVLPYVIGAVYFGIVVSRKMNEIEELELEKQRQYERQRNLLLSDVAHDLKTPMTTVAGYARALRMTRCLRSGGRSTWNIFTEKPCR